MGLIMMEVLVFVGVEMNLSDTTASRDEASALSCFPRYNMLSWHSANFSEAADNSCSYTHCFTFVSTAQLISSVDPAPSYSSIGRTRWKQH